MTTTSEHPADSPLAITKPAMSLVLTLANENCKEFLALATRLCSYLSGVIEAMATGVYSVETVSTEQSPDLKRAVVLGRWE